MAPYSATFDNFHTSAPIGDGSGPYGGDGVKGDGAIRFNTGDEVINNEIWTYTLSVVLTEGDMLSLSGAAFNANASNNSGFSVSLYNATDSRILVSSGNLGGTTTGLVAADINPFYEFNVSYTVVAADLTDTIEIRVFESLNNSSRDGFLDFVRVGFQAVPEPSRSFLALLGFTSLALRRRRPSDDRLLV